MNTLLADVFTGAQYNSNFTIATSVDDGVAPPITGIKNMTGTAVNDAPTASNLSAAETYTEDTAQSHRHRCERCGQHQCHGQH